MEALVARDESAMKVLTAPAGGPPDAARLLPVPLLRATRLG
jgi:hypothetical protein